MSLFSTSPDYRVLCVDIERTKSPNICLELQLKKDETSENLEGFIKRIKFKHAYALTPQEDGRFLLEVVREMDVYHFLAAYNHEDGGPINSATVIRQKEGEEFKTDEAPQGSDTEYAWVHKK